MSRRSPIVDVLAWGLAAVTVAGAARAWTSAPTAPPAPRADLSSDLARERVSVQRLAAENEALRRELDRMLLRRSEGATPNASASSEEAPAATDTASSDAANDERARRARDAFRRAAGGGDAEWKEALESLVDLVNNGTGVFPVLRDIYLEGTDERTRRTILPIMFYGGGGDEALSFIASEIITFEDPDFRREMLGIVAQQVRPDLAPNFKASFLAALEMDDLAARAAGVYGLRYVHDPDVTEALYAAANDPAEPVRRIALEALVSRGADRERMGSLLREETSDHLREVGECALRVAEESY